MMRLFNPLSPTCEAWAATVALSFFVPVETAQSALTSEHTTLQAQLPTSGKEVTGHASEPVNEITTSAASTKTTPDISAAEAPTETPPAAMPTSAKVEVPQSTDWDRTLAIAEPIITKPLIQATMGFPYRCSLPLPCPVAQK
jgi:hypothetical protein